MKKKLLTLCAGIGIVLGMTNAQAMETWCYTEYEHCMAETANLGYCSDFLRDCLDRWPN